MSQGARSDQLRFSIAGPFPVPPNNQVNRPENINYNQQNRGYMPNPPPMHNNGWNNHQNRNNLDMPNLQALGINPQGQNPSNQGQNMNNPLGGFGLSD